MSAFTLHSSRTTPKIKYTPTLPQHSIHSAIPQFEIGDYDDDIC